MRILEGRAWAAWVVWALVLGGGCASDPLVLVLALGEETSDGSSSSGTSVGGGSTSGGSTGNGSSSTSDGSTGNSSSSTSDGSTIDGSTSDGNTSDGSETGIIPVCGNGIVEAGETCDEQGQAAMCDEDCTPVECGDGVFNVMAGEQCDDGGESAMCDIDCTTASCGDGVFNAAAGEQCDGVGRTAACGDDCSLVTCGDGVVNLMAGEACDDAGETAECNTDCSLSVCGDGITNAAAGEACDNAGETIGCDTDCSPVVCGDGIENLMAGEACDDAGVSAMCDGDCTPAVCGDATLNAMAGETCEASDFAGGTCQGLGYGPGVLECGGCVYVPSGCTPAIPVLSLGFSQVKRFDFSWHAVLGAEYYQVLESPVPGDPYVQLGGDIIGESVSFEMPLHSRWQASYMLRACNAAGCTGSATVNIVGSLAEAVGYVKASNTGTDDQFGWSVELSGDGNTLAVGAYWEASNATGIGGNQTDSASQSGAVYVFVRDGAGAWSQQAYVKASNTGMSDQFGWSVALSGDGNTLAVGANEEDSNATGIGGNQADDSATNSGAVYVFVRDGAGAWSQQAYVKASNTGAGDYFGWSVALSGDDNTLAVGARLEDSNATGIGGNQAADSASESGAVYVFVRDGGGAWSQQPYVKASNTGADDRFGHSVALSGDGNTLAVGAPVEDSNATGIGGSQADDSAAGSGAVYVFVRDGGGTWSQQAYVKASNTGGVDFFGTSVALSGDGNTLAVGANEEDSNSTGIGGNQAADSASESGAVYVFVRDGAGAWSQQAYVKASNTGGFDFFGTSVALSGDGNTLAVGAPWEASNATGIGGNQADNSAIFSGAAYVFVRDGEGTWSQQTYVKASNAVSYGYYGYFCNSMTLSGDGKILAVGAYGEASNATGIGGNQADNSADLAGAVYLY